MVEKLQTIILILKDNNHSHNHSLNNKLITKDSIKTTIRKRINKMIMRRGTMTRSMMIEITKITPGIIKIVNSREITTNIKVINNSTLKMINSINLDTVAEMTETIVIIINNIMIAIQTPLLNIHRIETHSNIRPRTNNSKIKDLK